MGETATFELCIVSVLSEHSEKLQDLIKLCLIELFDGALMPITRLQRNGQNREKIFAMCEAITQNCLSPTLK